MNARRLVARVLDLAHRALLTVRMNGHSVLGRRPIAGGDSGVVSLTTYGRRLGTVHLVVESIARGAIRPRRIVLWLSPPEAEGPLPRGLTRAVRRGLEVRSCEDLGPHKKYHPYLFGADRTTEPLVTADDDVFYPHRWLQGLLEAHRRHPEDVLCHRARHIGLDAGAITPYSTWPLCGTDESSVRHFATGVSGVLYPARLQEHIRAAGEGFRTVAPRADDVWLHAVALRAGIGVRQVSTVAAEYPALLSSGMSALFLANVAGGGNDEQIARVYTDEDIAALGRVPG